MKPTCPKGQSGKVSPLPDKPSIPGSPAPQKATATKGAKTYGNG